MVDGALGMAVWLASSAAERQPGEIGHHRLLGEGRPRGLDRQAPGEKIGGVQAASRRFIGFGEFAEQPDGAGCEDES